MKRPNKKTFVAALDAYVKAAEAHAIAGEGSAKQFADTFDAREQTAGILFRLIDDVFAFAPKKRSDWVRPA